MMVDLQAYSKELQKELHNILAYWMQYAPDPEYGGFYGKVDNQNKPFPKSPKGIVLISRILWAFACAYDQTKKKEYLEFAARAYHYIIEHFQDKEYGGFYWSVDHTGTRLNDRKQIYGLAFCLYGLSEYYKVTQEPSVLKTCVDLFILMERFSYDRKRKGYYEAFSRDWQELKDLRLSEKDANEKKTMNTQLHVLEAYANLYRVWPDKDLKKQIENLLEVFAHHIVDDETHHLHLFFDENWMIKSKTISFGHDIEAAWLLQDAAETVRHPGWMVTMRSLAVKIARAAAEGLAEDGGLNYESENGFLISEKHWWPQAEAITGFFNAWQVSHDENYLQQSLKTWQFTNQYIKDHDHGEWFWGVFADHALMEGKDKIGFWKCPYHNSRACLELVGRIKILSQIPD